MKVSLSHRYIFSKVRREDFKVARKMKKSATSNSKPTIDTTPPNKGEGHRKRLRDKFLDTGLDGFHDYEVIELLLRTAKGLISLISE